MSDIFISYKREEQTTARKLADALEQEGLSVWWDPKLRVGEHFDDVIESALDQAKCVIVMWSERSVQSRYVRDEAMYALEQDKLVPVAVEKVTLPFRFKGVHTLSLLGWDGSRDFAEFRRLVDDISGILRSSREKEAGLKAEQPNRRSIDQKASKYLAIPLRDSGSCGRGANYYQRYFLVVQMANRTGRKQAIGQRNHRVGGRRTDQSWRAERNCETTPNG